MKMMTSRLSLVLVFMLCSCGSGPASSVSEIGIYESLVGTKVLVKVSGSHLVVHGKVLKVSKSAMLIQYEKRQEVSGLIAERVIVNIAAIEFLMLINDEKQPETDVQTDLLKLMDDEINKNSNP